MVFPQYSCRGPQLDRTHEENAAKQLREALACGYPEGPSQETLDPRSPDTHWNWRGPEALSGASGALLQERRNGVRCPIAGTGKEV